MIFQTSLQLHQTLNFEIPQYESLTILNQMTCTGRQINFEIVRDRNYKVFMNTIANKFYSLNEKIGLNNLGLKPALVAKLFKSSTMFKHN